jgi:hypothetical protein
MRRDDESPSFVPSNTASTPVDFDLPLIRNFRKRQSALQSRHEAINAQANSEIEALQRRIAEINVRAGKEHAIADQTAEQQARTLINELVLDARAKLTRPVLEWRIAPTRPLAVAIAIELSALIDRENDEIPVNNGMPRALIALGYTFADALIDEHPAAINIFGTASYGHWSPAYVERLSAIPKTFDSPPALVAALEAFETEITRIALSQQGTPLDRAIARWALVRDEDQQALHMFEKALQQADHERFCATYTRPAGWSRSSEADVSHELTAN